MMSYEVVSMTTPNKPSMYLWKVQLNMVMVLRLIQEMPVGRDYVNHNPHHRPHNTNLHQLIDVFMFSPPAEPT